MEPLGILLYGYNNQDVTFIKQSLDNSLDEELIIISGSGKEKTKISQILEEGNNTNFEDKKNKILLFLGFEDAQVSAVLNNFPRTENLKRPIFCGLTEQNINWTLEYLIEHLLEEEWYWSSKKEEP